MYLEQGGGEDNLEIFTEGKIIEKVHARVKRAREAHNFCEEKMEIWRKWGKIKEILIVRERFYI